MHSVVRVQMKTCSTCEVPKPLEDFGKRARSPDGFNPECKVCANGRNKRYYQSDHNGRRSKIREATIENIRQNRIRIYAYLLQHPCVDCQEDNPFLLEFDHQRDKQGLISQMHKCSWSRIKREIAKCEVRCVRCHRLKTAKDFGWGKLLDEAREMVENVGNAPT